MTLPQINEYIDPFEEEAVVLNYFKFNWVSNPKKLKKLAKRMEAGQPQHIVDGVLFSVQRSSNPVGYLQECFKQHDDYAIIFPEFIAAGHHGVLKHNDTLYPVTLKTQAKWLGVTDKWDLAQEIEIMESVVDAWMREHSKEKYIGKVLLFPAFGFSGFFRRIAITQDG